jgi:hypothetical protein
MQGIVDSYAWLHEATKWLAGTVSLRLNREGYRIRGWERGERRCTKLGF